jgi:OOP family OmpA-OmpF porin
MGWPARESFAGRLIVPNHFAQGDPMRNQDRRRTRSTPLMPRLRGTLTVIALAAALPALAQEARLGPYVGATIGKPDWKADSVGGISGDSSGTAAKVYGGWRLHKNFGAELSAVRLGRLSGPAGDAKANGYGLDAVGYLPITTDWTAFARAGVAQVKTSVPGASERNSAPKIGAGMQYQLSPTTALRGEWERYRMDAFGSKSNADMYSLGAQFSF